MRGLLVAGQIALCVSLLAAAGLLALQLMGDDVGPDILLSCLTQSMRSGESRVRFQDQFAERLRALPGVTRAAVTSELPTATVGRAPRGNGTSHGRR